MATVLKNTTIADVEIEKLGMTVPASGQIEITSRDLLFLCSDVVVSELEPLITSGDIVVNDGTNDISTLANAMAFLRYPDFALACRFNNSTNGFNSRTVQEAIEEAKKRVDFLQFQRIGTMNSDLYLYSGTDQISGLLSSSRTSGDASNGYRYGNSAPTINSINGKVVKIHAAIRGVAISNTGAATNVNVNLELWDVGMTNQGTKLGDITLSIPSASHTIGSYWNSSVDTNYYGEADVNIPVTPSRLLAVKFDSRTGNSNAVSIKNITIKLEVRET